MLVAFNLCRGLHRRGRGPALCLERSRRAPALWRRGEVQLDRLAAGTRARLGGEFSGAGLKNQRRDLLGAVDADPGAEQPAARAVATRLVRCQFETLAHHASTLASGAVGRGLHDGPTTTPSASTSKSSSFHSPGEREVEARLRTRDDMAISGFASSQPLSCERASADFHFVSSPTSSGDLITHLDDPRGGFLAPSFDREVYETNSE